MGGLEGLLGGEAGKVIGGLVQQFEAGQAHQVTPEDAAAHHDAVAQHLSPEQYRQAATEAAQKMTPEQRQELGTKLADAAKAQGHDVNQVLAPHAGNASSAGGIGALMSALQSSPGGITSLLSAGGAESLLKNTAVRSALIGVAAMAAKKFV
ncbi:MAG TPA: hypothetical protein VLJ76_11885 [Gaiellaceae bacterium]|nr:hypothetical protein [Gaiellaceae bacterium]